MNKRAKNNTKKVIIMLIIIMVCNFIVPNYSHAGLIEYLVIDPLLDSFAELLLFIPDEIFSGLQYMFMGYKEIKSPRGYYAIGYSPGTIFAGKIPMFNINFIKENTEPHKKIKNFEYNDFSYGTTFEKAIELALPKICIQYGCETLFKVSEENAKIIDEICNELENDVIFQNCYNNPYIIEKVINNEEYTIVVYANTSGNATIECYLTTGKEHYTYGDIIIDSIKIEDYLNSKNIEDNLNILNNRLREYFGEPSGHEYTYIKNEFLKHKDFIKEGLISGGVGSDLITIKIGEQEEAYLVWYSRESGEEPKYFVRHVINIEYEISLEGPVTNKLRVVISSWYNVMMTFSLAGLLSILVYIAIRIIIGSSTKDKAKYKKMLGNWFAAICILFIFHFFISMIFTMVRIYNRCYR